MAAAGRRPALRAISAPVGKRRERDGGGGKMVRPRAASQCLPARQASGRFPPSATLAISRSMSPDECTLAPRNRPARGVWSGGAGNQAPSPSTQPVHPENRSRWQLGAARPRVRLRAVDDGPVRNGGQAILRLRSSSETAFTARLPRIEVRGAGEPHSTTALPACDFRAARGSSRRHRGRSFAALAGGGQFFGRARASGGRRLCTAEPAVSPHREGRHRNLGALAPLPTGPRPIQKYPSAHLEVRMRREPDAQEEVAALPCPILASLLAPDALVWWWRQMRTVNVSVSGSPVALIDALLAKSGARAHAAPRPGVARMSLDIETPGVRGLPALAPSLLAPKQIIVAGCLAAPRAPLKTVSKKSLKRCSAKWKFLARGSTPRRLPGPLVQPLACCHWWRPGSSYFSACQDR